MSQAKRDENRVTTLLGVSDLNFETPVTVAVDPSTHEILVKGSFSVTGGATATGQTDGSQKTQLVDAGGEAVTITGGKLDVNASVDTTGLATSAKQDSIITAIGNIPGGGGIQYTEGDTDVSITGTASMMEVAANTLQPIQGTVADGLLVNLGTNNDISGTVTANAGTNLNTSTLALEAGGNLAAIKTKTDNIPALGQALAAASTPVVLTAAQVTTLTPPAAITGFATSAKQLADNHQVTVSNIASTPVITGFALETGGNLATLAGAVSATHVQVDVLSAPTTAVTGTFYQATQPISIATMPSTPVTGTFWQATQPVSGTVAVTNAGITTIAGAVTGTEMQVDVLTMPTITVNAHAVSNAGTFAVQAAATLAAETTKVIGTVNPALIASVIVGQKKITTSAVQLGANTLTNGVIFSALSTNVGNIFIGGSGVNATVDGTGTGYILEPGASISFAATNTNLYYVIGTANDVLSFAGS